MKTKTKRSTHRKSNENPDCGTSSTSSSSSGRTADCNKTNGTSTGM